MTNSQIAFFVYQGGSFINLTGEQPIVGIIEPHRLHKTSFSVMPSEEQLQILYAAIAGVELKVQALAGTGKRVDGLGFSAVR